MTLNDIIASVRDKLDDDEYPSASITSAANWFVNDLYHNVRTRQMETTGTLSVSTNDTSKALPTDFQLLLSARVTSPEVYSLTNKYLKQDEFMERFPGYDTYDAAKIYAWTDFGGAMRFSAPASGAHTIKIDYLRKPVDMVDGTDVCEVPDAYDEMVTLGTLARIMERNEDYAEASQERANLAPLMTAFIRNEGRSQIKSGPTIIKSAFGKGRSRRWEDA